MQTVISPCPLCAVRQRYCCCRDVVPGLCPRRLAERGKRSVPVGDGYIDDHQQLPMRVEGPGGILSDRVCAKGILPVLVSVNDELTCGVAELIKQLSHHVRGHDLPNRPVEILDPKNHRGGVDCIHVWVVAVRILLNVKDSFDVVFEDIVSHTNGGGAARCVNCEGLMLPRTGSWPSER